MVTTRMSLFTGRKVKPLLAMTGEVTLVGKVLPIGGVKEKALGARRAGIKTLVFPERNRKDVMEDLPDEVRNEIAFHFVSDVRQVLELALEPAASGAGAIGSDGNKQAGAPKLPEAKKPRRTPPPPTGIPDVVPTPPNLH